MCKCVNNKRRMLTTITKKPNNEKTFLLNQKKTQQCFMWKNMYEKFQIHFSCKLRPTYLEFATVFMIFIVFTKLSAQKPVQC